MKHNLITSAIRRYVVLLLLIFSGTALNAQQLTGPQEVFIGEESIFQWSYPTTSFMVNPWGTLTVTGGTIVSNGKNSIAIGQSATVYIRWNAPAGMGKVQVNYQYSPEPIQIRHLTTYVNRSIDVVIKSTTNPSTEYLPKESTGKTSLCEITPYSFYPTGNMNGVSAVEWIIGGEGLTVLATPAGNGPSMNGIPFQAWSANIHTTLEFNYATVSMRVKKLNVWTEWKSVRFNINGNAPPVSTYPVKSVDFLQPDQSYTITNSGAPAASSYQWRISGAATISGGGSSVTVKTNKDFVSARIEVRLRCCSVWGPWRGLDLAVSPKPAGISIKLDSGSDELCPGQKVRFKSEGNALYYDWEVVGDLQILEKQDKMIYLKAGANFNGGYVRAKAKNTGDWIKSSQYDLFYGNCCSAPAGSLSIYAPDYNKRFQNLCFLSDHQIRVEGPSAESYSWRVTGNAKIFDPGSSPRAYILDGGYYNTTNNWIMIETAGGYSGNGITISVTAYYCSGRRSKSTTQVYNTVSVCSSLRSGDPELEEMQEVETIEALQLYPNPAQDVLNTPGCENLRLINCQGAIVKEISGTVDQINIHDLEKGLYILQAHKNGQLVRASFQKE